MDRRKLLPKLKPVVAEVEQEQKPPETVSIDEEKTFKTKAKKKAVKIQEPQDIHPIEGDLPELPDTTPEPQMEETTEEEVVVPKPKTKAKKPITEERAKQLAEARAKSLETRRRKAKEKKDAMTQALNIAEKAVSNGFVNTSGGMTQKVSAPPPQQEYYYPDPHGLPPPSRTQVSAVKDTNSGVVDYDRISREVYSKFKSDQTLAQLEQDIRMDERRKLERDYDERLKKFEADQHRKYQRDQMMNFVSGKTNSVFRRSAEMRSRYKRNF
jgi:hypothetical protein